MKGYGPACHHLDRQLVAQKQAYSKERVRFRHVDRGQAPLTGPGDGGFVDIELAFRSVSQQGASPAAEWEVEIGDQG